jgi:hypothetical protein
MSGETMSITPTGIQRVDEQQERELIALAERKRVIAKTPEVLEAFAYGIDRKQPAPDRPRAKTRD